METGKTRFKDEQHAKEGRRSQVAQGHTDGSKLRIYVCEHCGGWHFTSQR